jgi:hypothetical protein
VDGALDTQSALSNAERCAPQLFIAAHRRRSSLRREWANMVPGNTDTMQMWREYGRIGCVCKALSREANKLMRGHE